jgi:hypothetical protein
LFIITGFGLSFDYANQGFFFFLQVFNVILTGPAQETSTEKLKKKEIGDSESG